MAAVTKNAIRHGLTAGTPATIVARRWREVGDLTKMWRYAFLAPRLGKRRGPGDLLNWHGYAQATGMLYGTKHGRENQYKTPPRDLGLRHPPSGAWA